VPPRKRPHPPDSGNVIAFLLKVKTVELLSEPQCMVVGKAFQGGSPTTDQQHHMERKMDPMSAFVVAAGLLVGAEVCLCRGIEIATRIQYPHEKKIAARCFVAGALLIGLAVETGPSFSQMNQMYLKAHPELALSPVNRTGHEIHHPV
jgi:hypothetical protein